MTAKIGVQFVSVAVGWELYERTGDPWALGLVGLAQVVPALLLTIPAGNLADRFPRRNLAMMAHALLALAALGLAAASAAGAAVELYYALLALGGAGRAFAAPSVNTILAQSLRPREFGRAYAWLVSSSQLAAVGGPAIAGALIALTGSATAAFLVAATGQLCFVATLATFPIIRPGGTASQRERRDFFAGVRFIGHNPVFLAAITLDLFAVLFGGALALMPVFAKDILAIGPGGLGLLRSAPPLGALLAALATTRLPPWQRPGRVLLATVAVFGLATVGFGLSRQLWLSLCCLFLVGASDSVSMVIRATLQQAMTPDRLRGRVAAVNSLFIGMSNELGALESGAVAALLSPVISVVGGGLATLAVVGAVALRWPVLARIGPVHTLEAREPAEQAPRRRSAAIS
jgi:MFS family permease